MEHPLHEVIAELLRKNVSQQATLIIDDAGKGDQRIPLFTQEDGGREHRLCCVDALVLVNGAIRLIVEVDESNVKPTHLTGKYLTSALAHFYIHERERSPVPKADTVSFLQIVSTKKLEAKSKKPDQWRIIEEAIQAIPALGRIGSYRLFFGKNEDFEPDGRLYEDVASLVRRST